MKKPTRVLGLAALAALVVAVLLWRWEGVGRDLSAGTVAPGAESGAVHGGVAQPMPRTERLRPAAPPATTSASMQERVLGQARTLDQDATLPDSAGCFTRRKVVETQEKYPFLRIEERWQREKATGQDVLLGSVLMAADHLVVRVQDHRNLAALRTQLGRFGASILREVPNSQLVLVQTGEPSLRAFDTVLAELRQLGLPVLFAEPDYVVFASFTPDDPSFGQLWGLNNAGQTGGTPDSDIDAPEAWDITRGNASVTVGVIDTGVDYTHPDLAGNMWTNSHEILGNGIDDDNNGYVDDVRGWNFVGGNNDPLDDHYHGTHCAGTIGAVADNGIGVAGVAHHVRIMPLKFLSASGSGYTSDAVEAVLYATANGAQLTSNSWGGGGYSQLLKDAVDEARAVGVLFVAAAGNEALNSDSMPSYPAAYDSPNIISVAASDSADQLAYFSNYGAQTVDLAAPGVDIYSTSPQSGYRSLSGTSMACPHVSGACVLMLAANPAMGWNEIKQALFDNTDAVPALAGKVVSGGRLNIGRALIVSSGPYVTISAVQVKDGRNGGGSGNGDGVVNPGEQIALVVTMRNMGNELASAVSSELRLGGTTTGVTLLNAAQSWGTIGSGSTVSNSATPFHFAVADSALTPQRMVLQLVTSDTDGHIWNSTIDLTIYTRSTVSGRVAAMADGAAAVGATVSYVGPFSGSTTTDSAGNYQLVLLDGSYQLSVRAAGFNPPASQTVVVPGDHTGVDFALGRSRLQVSPASLAANQNEDQITSQNLLVSNTGDYALTVTLDAVAATAAGVVARPTVATPALAKLGARQAATYPTNPPPACARTAAAATLPFRDSFESGAFADWTTDFGNGTRVVTAATAAVGAMSFEYHYAGSTSHFNGIHRDFAGESRPRSVSFWVRPGSNTSASGYFVLMGEYRELIWFFAGENGCFYINEDYNGDYTVPYLPDTWYHVEFRNFDWTAKTFDYYVDGALQKAGIGFRDPAATIVSSVYLYNFSPNSTAWWDDIRLSAAGVDWLSYAPSALTLQPGQSAPVSVTFDSTNLTEGTFAATLELISNDPANPVIGVPTTLTVKFAPNTPPVANSQTVPLLEDTTVAVTLTGVDADNNPLNAFITQLPASGVLYQTVDGTTRGAAITAVPTKVTHVNWKLIYEPASNVSGTVPFQFVLRDKRSQSVAATVSLVIASVNDAPLAYNDAVSSLPGSGPLAIAVLSNDSDPDGDALSIDSFSQPTHGTVGFGSGGVLIYTPEASFVDGSDSFTYTVGDGNGGTATARVSIDIGYLSAGDWSMFGNTASHTGTYPASLGGKRFVANWTIDRVLQTAPVAVASGSVFGVTRTSDWVSQAVAFDLATGLPTWRHTFIPDSSLNGPSYHNGRLFLQMGKGSQSQLWSLDAKTGTTVWSAPFSAQWEGYLPPSVNETGVYIDGGTYGGIYGFARANGAPLFFQSLEQYDQWTPTLLGGRVFSFVKGFFREHDATTGAILWSLDFGWGMSGSMNRTAACGSRRAFMVNDSVAGTELIAVDHTTRTIAWRVTGTFRGTPALGNANSCVYAIMNGAIRAFDVATGAALGDYVTGSGSCINQPIVTNDALIASDGTKTFVFDLATRALLQTIDCGGYLSLSNGALLILGTDGVLRCHRIDTGNNPAPVAADRTLTGIEDSALAITLDGTDANGDALVAIVTSLPAKGTLYQSTDGVTPGQPISQVPVLVTHPQGRVVYRPTPDGFGAVYTNFKYKVNDGVFNSAEATITVDITGVNDAPVANDDSVRLRPGTELDHFWPTANDLDVDGDVLRITAFTQPVHGTVSRETDGSLHYTPAAGFLDGTDTFGYTAADALGVTATAIVTITVSDSFGREWPTFGGGSDHTGSYPGSLGADPLVLRWQYDAGTAINPLAVAEGRVFYTIPGNWNNLMHAVALDTTTGAEVWRTEFAAGSSLTPPSYFNGSVYLQRGNHSSDSQLCALASDSGAIEWRAPFAAQWQRYMAPAVSSMGVFVDGGGGGMGCTVSISTGLSGFSRRCPSWMNGRQRSMMDAYSPSWLECSVSTIQSRVPSFGLLA